VAETSAGGGAKPGAAPAGPPALDVIERLRGISTASLCTELFRLGFRSVYLEGVRPAARGPRMVGPAVTVRFAPAREDVATYERLGDPAYPQRHAIERVEPGQVLVMDCRGVSGAAGAGDILVARLLARGAAGLVLDGGVRDWESAQSSGLPVFALGPAAPAHVARLVAVDAGVPIGCGGVLVMPGDIMVGDADGVVCVPRSAAEAVADRGSAREDLEAFVLDKIRAGAPLPGTYPPGPTTLAEYEAHRRARGR
jgi:regulator of RNase E activity RraA